MKRLARFAGRGITALMIAAAVLSPTGASALCSQADLTGTWWAYSLTFAKTSAYKQPIYQRCKWIVASNGDVAETDCFDSTGRGGPITQTVAKMTSAAICNMDAEYKFLGATYHVSHSTMSRDKLTIQGVGTFSGPGLSGLFTIALVKL